MIMGTNKYAFGRTYQRSLKSSSDPAEFCPLSSSISRISPAVTCFLRSSFRAHSSLLWASSWLSKSDAFGCSSPNKLAFFSLFNPPASLLGILDFWSLFTAPLRFAPPIDVDGCKDTFSCCISGFLSEKEGETYSHNSIESKHPVIRKETSYVPPPLEEGSCCFLTRARIGPWSEADRLSHPDNFSTWLVGDMSMKHVAWCHAKPLAPWPSGLVDIRTYHKMIKQTRNNLWPIML